MLRASWLRRPARLRLWPRRREPDPRPGRPRVRSVILSLVVVGYGITKCLTRDAMSYSNYWGGQVFAPFVVLAGLIVLVGALRGREPRPFTDRRGRPIRLPTDDFDRPWMRIGG